jgi:uncharacterized protein
VSDIGADSRADAIDWARVSADLDDRGWTLLPRLLTDAECEATAALYGRVEGFRSQVIMARHGFGRGEYRYFSYPLPSLVQTLRTTLYPHLAPLANRWHERMGMDVRFPGDHAAFIARCHQAGQDRPTPLLLQYGPEDYNCLHQDLYGEHIFPLQVAVLLSQPGEDFERRRVHPDRTTSPHADEAVGRAIAQGRRRRVRGRQPPGPGRPRRLPGQASPWRQPPAVRAAPHPRGDLPRRRVNPCR